MVAHQVHTLKARFESSDRNQGGDLIRSLAPETQNQWQWSNTRILSLSTTTNSNIRSPRFCLPAYQRSSNGYEVCGIAAKDHSKIKAK